MKSHLYRTFRLAFSAVIVAVVATTLIDCATPAQAQEVLGLPGHSLQTVAAELAGTSGTLPPATRRTKPYRDFRRGECADSLCTFVFNTVRPNRLLEITNVSCTLYMAETNGNQYAVLSSEVGPPTLSQVATIPGVQTIPVGPNIVVNAVGTGPYFFRGGDDVQILSGGTQGTCNISGYISRTD